MNIFRRIYRKLFGGYSAPRRYVQLFQSIDECRPIHILEIGTWNGNRAVELIKHAAQYRPVQDIHYYGFDLFEEMTEEKYKEEISKRPPPLDVVKEKLSATGAQIHLYKGNTLQTLPHFVGTAPKVDFIFIDGGHHLDTVASDWKYAKELMHESTIVIFDDYWPDQPNKGGSKIIVDSLDPNVYTAQVLPIIDRFDHPDFGALTIQFAKVSKRGA